MARINRATQKIFGSNANSTAITEFGTAKNAEPEYITNGDVEAIQANPSFLTGWANSLEQDLAPFMQDSNGLWYMITSQVAYLLKNGIAEYDAGTSYDLGDLAKVVQQNGTVVIYKSLQDDNLGHAITESSYWVMYSADDNLAKYEIGLPQPSLTNNKLANEVWLDGTEGSNGLVNIVDYPKLFALWGVRYGGDGVYKFRLPNMTGRVLWGVDSFGLQNNITYLSPTLPNIKGAFSGFDVQSSFKGTDAFYVKNKGNYNDEGGDYHSNYGKTMGFDANRYNTIYQDDATVRPPSIAVRWKTRYE